jgi:hypothetical protein
VPDRVIPIRIEPTFVVFRSAELEAEKCSLFFTVEEARLPI